MFIPIILISTLIQIYSLEYMGNDPNLSRFFSFLSIFSFSMLIIVSAENLFILLLGWELVGISSYLLISFWNTRISANLGALSALFQNKVGDLFFILGVTFTLSCFSDLSLSTLFSLSHHINSDLIFLVSLFILGAAISKSALYPLNTWLVRAMEGPTSVSALLHSSTMVTAGVFLLIRISPLLEYTSTLLIIIIWLGSIGALFGAAAALVENDIKGIIAYSTCSQLGYMTVAVGMSKYNIALFHLLMHAGFKSLLFLSSGAIIHALIGENQDIRKMGGLINNLPLTYLVFLFGSLSLMAAPFLSGMYSKDLILEILCVPFNFTHSFAYILTLIAASFTSFYSIRVLLMVFLSSPNHPLTILPYIHDSGFKINLPLIILSFAAVFLGYLSNDLFLGIGSEYFNNSIFIHPNNNRILDATNAHSLLPLIPLLFILCIGVLLIPLSLNPKRDDNNSPLIP